LDLPFFLPVRVPPQEKPKNPKFLFLSFLCGGALAGMVLF
jgi:hypothetical protein